MQNKTADVLQEIIRISDAIDTIPTDIQCNRPSSTPDLAIDGFTNVFLVITIKTDNSIFSFLSCCTRRGLISYICFSIIGPSITLILRLFCTVIFQSFFSTKLTLQVDLGKQYLGSDIATTYKLLYINISILGENTSTLSILVSSVRGSYVIICNYIYGTHPYFVKKKIRVTLQLHVLITHGASFQVSQLFSLLLLITKKFRLVYFYRMVTASNPTFRLENYSLAFAFAIVLSLQRNQVT